MASGPSGHIEQLPSGSWRAKVYAGSDPLTGREIRLRRTCRTERAAQIEPGKRFIEHPNVPLFAVDPASRRPAWQQVADTIGTRSAPGCWRRGELCALQVCDVDLDNRILHIMFNYVVAADRRVRGDAKTHQHRYLAIDQVTCAMIGEHLDAVRSSLADVGVELHQDACIFSNDPAVATP